MSKKLPAAVTIDVDTLESIYKGQGSRRPGGYTHAELSMGLENISRFFARYNAKATLFMVGNDFKHPENHACIRSVAAEGHEIANHTLTHAQGFRLLSSMEKEIEISGMEDLCDQVTGRKPVGFRSPGWNIGDDALSILKRRGYLYDSSVFPTSLMPLLKLMHWYTMRSRGAAERTTLGHLKYMFAPITPYLTNQSSFASPGTDGIYEFPITVTPILRLPFFATFLVSTGITVFEISLASLKFFRRPIQFQFHLSDFVDYSHPDLEDQVPQDGQGQYVPYALRLSLSKKMEMFTQVMDSISQHYTFHKLESWTGILKQESEKK